jgi:phage tail sheath protein FI
VRDGAVVAREENPDGALSGVLRARIDVGDAGWLAARAWGRRRTSYGHALWAHTSPVYLRDAAEDSIRRASARGFVTRIDEGVEWLRTAARFDEDRQRDRMLALFAGGREVYERLARDL